MSLKDKLITLERGYYLVSVEESVLEDNKSEKIFLKMIKPLIAEEHKDTFELLERERLKQKEEIIGDWGR